MAKKESVRMFLNIDNFETLRRSLGMNNTRMAEKLYITRSALNNAKKGKSIGIELLAGFMHSFPAAKIENFFFTRLSIKDDN